VFYFFAAPVETALGTWRFFKLFYLSALGGAASGLILSNVSGFQMPFMGMLPSLLSLIVLFGLLYPNATILLMFILPIKAKYINQRPPAEPVVWRRLLEGAAAGGR
jgi:membrane associated rhomboid family serine protease